MSEDNKKDEPIVGYPKGSVKTIHSALDSFKLKAKIDFGQTKKGVKITYSDDYGGQKVQLPEGKFQGKALEVPANKALYEQLKTAKDQWDEDDEGDFTLTFLKGDQYWDFKEIVSGTVGVAGVLKAGETAGGSGGGNYNPAGAIIGKIQNNAMDLVIKKATKTTSFDDLVNMAMEELEGATASLYAKFDIAAKAFYEATQGAGASTPAPSDAPKAEDKPEKATKEDVGGSEDEDFDEDIPF